MHVVKSLEPLFIMLFCWLLMLDAPELNWHMFAAITLVVLGSVNFSIHDATWNLAAFSCAMLSNFSNALMRVRTRCHAGPPFFGQSFIFLVRAKGLGWGALHIKRGSGLGNLAVKIWAVFVLISPSENV